MTTDQMPSIRNHPPAPTTDVTLLRSCIAAGEKQQAGAVVKVSAADANLLIGSGMAELGATAPEPKAKRGRPKKKVAEPSQTD